ncbi:uncharacterized protein BJ171DRAFT_16301 [Polychytrium aggregatum]|uniref:uncharacterized protein n=1 Tax=Polychytrium aggregatum TaxID=110093 RepID=UPI0022FE58CD|nr:uncharacterized protein BJ171DRAFT_16301 [Polychytrium aggregatum]KAI9206670.1 hypothetical protein BJ171DRAFT_16301 [Polychytrium aggregatum]
MSQSRPKKRTSGASFDATIRKFLEDHVLFKGLDENFITLLASEMQTRIYNDKDYVIRKGEVGRAMFFVFRGQVNVISEDGETIVNVMKDGSFFGEIGLLFSVPRTASCRASGRSIILTLTKDRLQKCVKDYPKVAEAISHIAEERFASYMKQKEEQHEVEFGEELKLSMTNDDLKSVPLFRDCEVGFLHMLALHLKPVQYRQNNLIIKKGDYGMEMYFVVRGIAEVFGDDGKVYAQFHPGSFFGEVALLFRMQRTASVRCVSNVINVFKLTKESLDNVLKNFPEINAKIQIEAKKRFQEIESREHTKITQNVSADTARTEVEVARERLKTVPLFKDGPVGFLHELALALKLRVYKPGERIINKDEIGTSMYFVVDGIAEVTSEDGSTVYAELGENSFFGEVALFFEVNRTASVQSKTGCTVFELSKDSLHSVLDKHPSLQAKMREKALENYNLFQSRQAALKQIKERSKDHKTEQYDVEATIDRLKGVPIFKGCGTNFLQSLAAVTTIQLYKSGDIIFKKGEKATQMFFIVRGTVEITSEDLQTVYDTIKEGGFFGEVGLLRGISRTASIKVSSSDCDVIILTSKSLEKVLKEYPESFHIISLEAEKRYQLTEQRRKERVAAEGAEVAEDEGPGTSFVEEFRPELPSVPFAPIPANEGPTKARKSSSFSSIFKFRGKKEKSGKDKPGSESDSAIDKSQSSNSVESAHSIQSEKGPTKLGKFFQNIKNTLGKKEEKTRVVPKAISASPSISTPTERRKVTNILEFNDLEFGYIISFLCPRDRMRLRGVCTKWNDMLHDSRFWSIMDFREMFNTVNGALLDHLFLVAGHQLLKVNFASCWQVYDDDLRTLAVECPNVTSLCISNCWKITDRGLAFVAQASSKLVELDISYCGQLSGAAFADHKWGTLRKFDMTYCKQIGDEYLEKLLCRTTEIQDLRLRRCVRISDFGLFLVVRYCRYLRSIDLSDCEQISDKCLKWIASSCYNLTSFNLTFCTRITNGGLYDLSLGCQHFESLNLSHCVHLTDAAIVFFSDSIKSLRFLSLRRCKKITDGVMGYLGRTAPHLRVLDVTGCPNISQAAKGQLETTLRGIVVLMDVPREKRGICAPGEGKLPRALEVPLSVMFTSIPASDRAQQGRQSSADSGKKRAGSKSSGKRQKSTVAD